MNTPEIFQIFVNDTLWNYFDNFVVVYLDDILIYSDILEKHSKYVRKVLKKLEAAIIGFKLEKYVFDKQKVNFLDFVIGVNGISIDSTKVTAI